MKPDGKPTDEVMHGWAKDPRNWKLGFFYFNREDKRLFPPKRYFGGWTINFANPLSILAMIAVVILSYFISKYLDRR